MSEPSEADRGPKPTRADPIYPRVIQRSADLRKRLEGGPGQREKLWALQQAAKESEPAIPSPSSDAASTSRPAVTSHAVTPILTDSDSTPALGSAESRTISVGGTGASDLVILGESAPPRQRHLRALPLIVGPFSILLLITGLMWPRDIAEPPSSAVLNPPNIPGRIGSEAKNGADGPVDANQWQPLPLTAPAPGQNSAVVAGNLSETLEARSAQALAPPASSEQPPSPAPDKPVREAAAELTNVVQTAATMVEVVPPKVVLHLSPALSERDQDRAQSALRSAGFDLTSSSMAAHRVMSSQVFFFHQEDAANAARVAEAIGARVRDFSAYRPLPERGRLEIWLAQDG